VDSGEDRGSTPLASSLRFWSAAQKAKAATPERSVGGLLLKLPPDAQKDYGLAGQQMQRFYVYVLVSEADETIHYTGTTQELEARLTKHNHAHTSKHRPWRIQTAMAFDSEVKARAFEKYLKTGSGREFARRHF
jgi:putative endonuclease